MGFVSSRIISPSSGPIMQPPPKFESPEQPENWGYDLLLYGNEHITRGSDTGTLIAFGAIAIQELQEKTQPHQHLGCFVLLFSVLLCALVHFAIGGASVRRARTIIGRTGESRAARMFRQANQAIAWVSAALQFVLIAIGIFLVLKQKPPAFVEHYLLEWF
jgi:hypothetical protein